MLAKDNDGQSNMPNNSSFVDDTNMVSSINENFNPQASSASQNGENSDTSSYESSSPIIKEVSSDSMSSVRKSFRDQGFSNAATNVIMSSWRVGTKKQYQTHISKWLLYCKRKQINSVSVAVVDIIHFLTEQFEAGLSYSSLNTARGALSSLGLKLEQYSVGSHPLVIRFMKGVYNLRPTKPRYHSTWSVDLVLNYLKKLSPVNKLSLKELTLKLVMLTALTNAARVQTIHMLSVNSFTKLPSEFVFQLENLLKQSRPGFDCSVMKLKAYPPDRRLCVYTVLKEYLERTKDIRGNSEKLLLSYIKPYKAVTRDTISRWIKLVMTRSGIDTKIYSSHSVRGASTSKAKNKMVPMAEILQKAGWSNQSTFARFYDKKVIDSKFEEAVLGQEC